MTGIERCKRAILDYEEAEWGDSQPRESFDNPHEVGIAYCQFQSMYGDKSSLEMADEQWIVNLERNRVEMCIDGESQVNYTFNDADEMADWLEENLDFDWLIGLADTWCEEHEDHPLEEPTPVWMTHNQMISGLKEKYLSKWVKYNGRRYIVCDVNYADGKLWIGEWSGALDETITPFLVEESQVEMEEE